MVPFEKTFRVILSLFASLGFGSRLNIAGCGAPLEQISGDSPDIELGPDSANIFEFVDISSGLIGEVEFGTGDKVFVVGDKLSDGTVTKINALAIVDANHTLYEFFFDAQGLPIQLRVNNSTWDIQYDQSDPTNIHTATYSHDGVSATVELPPDFNTLIHIYQNGSLASDSNTRSPNVLTLVGGASILIGAATLLGGPVGFIAAAGGYINIAGGTYLVYRSVSNHPETKNEALIGNVLTAASLATGIPSFFSASIKVGSTVAITVSEGLDHISALTTLVGDEQNSVQNAANEAFLRAQAHTLTGCWNVEIDTTQGDFEFVVNMWQFQNNDLATIWASDGSYTREVVRLNRMNVSFGGAAFKNIQHSTILNPDGSFYLSYSYDVSIQKNSTYGTISASFIVPDGKLVVDLNGTRWIQGNFRFHSHIKASGAEGAHLDESVDSSGTVYGTPADCPDPMSTAVLSQEELRSLGQ